MDGIAYASPAPEYHALNSLNRRQSGDDDDGGLVNSILDGLGVGGNDNGSNDGT